MSKEKDPACLFYISDWLTSTAEMDADCRGWYLNLILHQYDKQSLPNDVEKLAVLCNVKFSEFERFKQVFEQVLKQKFELTDENRLKNKVAEKILQGRELFKEKRSQSGKLSYILKYFRRNYKKQMDSAFEKFIKNNISIDEIDTKNEQMLKQVFEHLFELYRNENENENKDINVNKNIKEREQEFKERVFKFTQYPQSMLIAFFNYWSQYGINDKKMLFEKQKVFQIEKRLITWKSKEKPDQKPDPPKPDYSDPDRYKTKSFYQ
jgi:hypothetical protein